MSTVLEPEKKRELITTFGVDLAVIEQGIAADLALTVTDDETREVANRRRLGYVKIRNQIDKRRLALNAEHRKAIKDNDELAESVQIIIGKGEDHVTKLVNAYDDAKEKAEQAKRDAVFNARNDRLKAVGLILDRIVIDSLTDADIDQRIAERVELNRLRAIEDEKKAAEEAERQKQEAAEKERLKQEAAKLAADRAELAKQKLAQDAELAELRRAAKAKIDADNAELARQREALRVEQEKVAAANRAAEAARQAAAKAEQDRIEAARVEAEKEAARQRAEAERPYLEKLLLVAEAIRNYELPEGSRTERVRAMLVDAADRIVGECSIPF